MYFGKVRAAGSTIRGFQGAAGGVIPVSYTHLLLGLIVMVLYKPRTWCAFCPMGTMTQGICKLKNKE